MLQAQATLLVDNRHALLSTNVVLLNRGAVELVTATCCHTPMCKSNHS
jgi:hypothetical protein